MLKNVLKVVILFSSILNCSVCGGLSLSRDDGEELLASLQNLDKNAHKITSYLNGYKDTQAENKVELHPSLWSPEYYQVVNPKTSVNINQAEINQLIASLNNATNAANKNNNSFSSDNLAKVNISHKGERHKSNYKIERETEADSELIGFGASSRTIVKPVEKYVSGDKKNDNALKWIKTSGWLIFYFSR
jgi:hypothetical protein